MKNPEPLEAGMRSLRYLFASLPDDKHRKIMLMRFGFITGHPSTLEEVGKEIGVTRERIRQIEAKCLEIMRQILKGLDIKI